MSIKKIMCLSALVVLLNGCIHPTDRGQQYQDGPLAAPLNRTTQINTNAPRDFSTFARQSDLVVENSPSLSASYGVLYQQLDHWVKESGDPKTLPQYGVQIAQVGGADQRGNVLFTGYFSPVIELRHTPDETYRFPLYAKPDCTGITCPTRAEIYQGALSGLGLELGYAANRIEPFIMEIQGSGFVHFGDDNTLEYFAYAGKNDKPYVSIGKILIEEGEVPRKKMSLQAIKDWVKAHSDEEVSALLEQNPSYVFFSPKAAAPVTGTAGIPLLPMASVAGDRDLFPMGTPILAEVPLLNADGTWSGAHELRLLVVLDTGGAVTDSHLDLYHGMGPRAGREAGHYRHFGRVWKLGLAAPVAAEPSMMTAASEEVTSSNHQGTSSTPDVSVSAQPTALPSSQAQQPDSKSTSPTP